MKEKSGKKAVSLGKALVFKAGGRSWACELNKVKEIVRFATITPLPNAISKVAGVINVRGEVVPVVTFWPEECVGSHTHSKTVVIIQTEQEVLGLKVDRVSSIEDIHAYDLGNNPEEQDILVPEIISCHVYLSNSGLTPLVDARLVIECIKAQSSLKGHVDDKDIHVSSAAGGIP